MPDKANGGRVVPLDRVTWREQIDRFHSWVETAGYNDCIEQGLRKAYYLSVLAPDPFWSVFASPCQEEEFDAAVEGDDLSEAAHLLLNPALAISTMTLDGRSHVTVRVAKLGFKGRFASFDHSTALLGAWAACIQAVDDDDVGLASHQSSPA